MSRSFVGGVTVVVLCVVVDGRDGGVVPLLLHWRRRGYRRGCILKVRSVYKDSPIINWKLLLVCCWSLRKLVQVCSIVLVLAIAIVADVVIAVAIIIVLVVVVVVVVVVVFVVVVVVDVVVVVVSNQVRFSIRVFRLCNDVGVLTFLYIHLI